MDADTPEPKLIYNKLMQSSVFKQIKILTSFWMYGIMFKTTSSSCSKA